jgi:hypothetical protein
MLVVCSGPGGCGQDSEPAPPEIHGLSLPQSTTLLDSGDEAIYGFFEFEDPNGDAQRVVFEVELPDGTVDEVEPMSVAGLEGRPSGTVSFSLVYSRDTTGRYDLTVWLVDAAGLPSNALTGTIYSRF